MARVPSNPQKSEQSRRRERERERERVEDISLG